MSEYIVEVDDKVAEVFVERFDWKTVTLFGHHLVGEIVRCRDCRYYKCGDDGWWCLRSISTKSNRPDGFCAWGERRGE